MTAIERAFLDDIAAQPLDHFPRLAYADWLEEHGNAEWAEFIRVQIELVRLEQWEMEHYTVLPRREKLRRREIELLSTEGPPTLGTKWRRHPNGREETLAYRWAPVPILNCDWWEFRRGFISSITLPCAAFLEHAADIIEAVPMLEEVRLTDKEPLQLNQTAHPLWSFVCYPGDYYATEHTSYYLPASLFKLMAMTGDVGDENFNTFSERDSAIASLSQACLTHAREQLARHRDPRLAEPRLIFGT